MMLLQFVFMFVPSFLCFCKKNMLICNLFLCLSQASFVLQKIMLFLQFLLMSVPRFLCFCKKYVVFAIFSYYVCPKFLKRHIMLMWFALYLYCTGKYFSINTQQLLLSSENSRSNSKLDTRKMFHPLLGARCRRVTFSLSALQWQGKMTWPKIQRKKEAKTPPTNTQVLEIVTFERSGFIYKVIYLTSAAN